MKTPQKKPLVFVSSLIVVSLLLSWKYFDDEASSTSLSFSKNQLTDAERLAWLADNVDGKETDQPPAAEDVLVQRISGDNSHLLLMAYYSKESYSKPSFTIENGYSITLRDDGRGEDKTAGDGLYTAKIPADVQGLRKQSINMLQQMRANGFKPVRYVNRQQIIDPNIVEGFELTKFDTNQPVSISGLTNALSADFRPLSTAQNSMSKSSTINRAVTTSALPTAQAALSSTPSTLDSLKKNSILITDLRVVEDSTRTWNYCTQKGNVNGPWTFGTLMRQLASKSPTQIASDSALSVYIKTWLKNWETTRVINRDSVKPRMLVDSIILNPWQSKSQSNGAPVGRLDMRFAPFKLIAIVNRFDLRSGLTCGEGRLVFCLIDPNCGGPLQFTVIFEYGINKPNTCRDQHAWAQQWVNLKNFPLGSAQYNRALQNITDQFTKCGTNPTKTNQSSLNQLRTNEIALVLPTSVNHKLWEFREFTLSNPSGNLGHNIVKQAAADKYNARVVDTNVQRMVAFVNQHQASINAGTDIVPSTWQGAPFVGGACRVLGAATGQSPAAYHWDGTSSANASTFITDDNARFNYSLQSCSGCHAGETQTAFTHINPAFFGRQAGLSGFLSGVKGIGGAIDFDRDSANLLMQVQDAAMRPSSNPTLRNFNDIDRRARDLKAFVSTSCGTVLSISSQLMFQPNTMVH
jgi:hypothetical protein